MARLTPPLKWHGGKQYLAERFVELMPRHLHYVEPFAGGLAVLFAKPYEGISEVVNDMHGELTNFWSVLRDVDEFERFHRMVEATPFSEVEWDRAKANRGQPDLDEVERAFWFFVFCRQSMSGRMTSFAPLTRNRTRRGMNEQASAWLGAVEGLPAVHSRLKRVVVLNRPAIEVIRKNDEPGTMFYLDPPYLHETRATTTEYGPNEMGEAQHSELLEVLSGLEGAFMLSGYQSDLYADFAKRYGWSLKSFELPNNAASGSSKRRMVECLWANFDLDSPPKILKFKLKR